MEILSTPNNTVREKKMATFMARITTGMVVPNFVKQVMRSYDPSLYQTPDNMNEYLGAVLRDIPMPAAWKENVLLKRYNALGEPIRLTSPSVLFSLIENVVREDENKPTNLGRFVSTGTRTDPVWTWLADKNVALSAPSSYEQLLGLPMTDEMRQIYAVKRGQLLKRILENLVETEQFKNMSEPKAQEFVTRITSKVGRVVKTGMVADPDLIRVLIQSNRPEVFRKYGL
jgi:hypothetical protein